MVLTTATAARPPRPRPQTSLVRSLSETLFSELPEFLPRRATAAANSGIPLGIPGNPQRFHQRFLNYEWRFGEVNFAVRRSSNSSRIRILCSLLHTFLLQQPTWRYWGEERLPGAIYTVYLKKVRYHSPSKTVHNVSQMSSGEKSCMRSSYTMFA